MDDTSNLELPGSDNYVWRDNGAASYSRFYTGFQYPVQHFVMDTFFLSDCRSGDDANCRKIRKQHRIHACSKSCTGHWDVYVPNSLWNHQGNPSREKACDRSDNFQFDIFWRRCSGAGGWRNYNSKLWVASHILFNISSSSYTWPGDQKDPSRHKAGNLSGESRGRGRK